MTDKEIVKALECCGIGEDFKVCDDCPCCIEGEKAIDCVKRLHKATLDLINHLQAQVKKCEKVEHFADKTIATLQAENKRLKAPTTDWLVRGISPEQLEKEKIQALMDIAKKYAKAEAYKEFAEKAKEFMHNKFKALDEYEFEYITERDIDNLIKEIIGE